jgi:hypothetical protein
MRTKAAKIGGVGLQIIRDWVLRFNARGPAGLLDGKSPGQPSKLNHAQREAVARMIESGPILAVQGVVRWSERSPRSAHRLDLHLRCRLPDGGQRRGPDHARLQGDEPPSRRDRQDRRASRPRRAPRRSGRLAHVDAPNRAAQHDHHRPAAEIPELNPVENVWQFMRDNWLSNRVFKSYDDLVDHCCTAWNNLIDQPWRIMSIGLRDWAHRF